VSYVGGLTTLALSLFVLVPAVSAQTDSIEKHDAQDAAHDLADSLFRTSATSFDASSVDAESARRRSLAIQAVTRAAAISEQIALDIGEGRGRDETRNQMEKLRGLEDLLRTLGPDATQGLLTRSEVRAILAQWDRLQRYHANQTFERIGDAANR